MATPTGEGTSGGGKEALIETRHGDQPVGESMAAPSGEGPVAEEFGGSVTVLAVSPRSGAPRVNRFAAAAAGGRGPEQLLRTLRRSAERIDHMSLPEVVAFEERLQALKRSVLQRISEKEAEEAAAGPPAEGRPEPETKNARVG